MTETNSRAPVPVLSTLANGLEVIEVLANGRSSIRTISEAVGLQRQTVYRLLRTMVSCGWVEREPLDDTYRLTTRMWSIAARSFNLGDVRAALAPTVSMLADHHGETVHLATYEHGSVVYIDKADGWQPIRSYTELGGSAPAYCVATGKMLLALQSDVEQARVLAGPLERHTPETITDADSLRDELNSIRKRGYALNRGEWREGVGGVAVPLPAGPNGMTLAIGFSGPAARILPKADTLAEELRSAVAAREAAVPQV